MFLQYFVDSYKLFKLKQNRKYIKKMEIHSENCSQTSKEFLRRNFFERINQREYCIGQISTL